MSRWNISGFSCSLLFRGKRCHDQSEKNPSNQLTWSTRSFANWVYPFYWHEQTLHQYTNLVWSANGTRSAAKARLYVNDIVRKNSFSPTLQEKVNSTGIESLCCLTKKKPTHMQSNFILKHTVWMITFSFNSIKPKRSELFQGCGIRLP